MSLGRSNTPERYGSVRALWDKEALTEYIHGSCQLQVHRRQDGPAPRKEESGRNSTEEPGPHFPGPKLVLRCCPGGTSQNKKPLWMGVVEAFGEKGMNIPCTAPRGQALCRGFIYIIPLVLMITLLVGGSDEHISYTDVKMKLRELTCPAWSYPACDCKALSVAPC